MRLAQGTMWAVAGLGIVGGIKTADVLYDRNQTADSYANSAVVIEDCFERGERVIAILPSDARPVEVTSCTTNDANTIGLELQPGAQQIFTDASDRVNANVRNTGLAVGTILVGLEIAAVSAAAAARRRDI